MKFDRLRLDFLKWRFRRNPTGQRGEIDRDSCLADASGYDFPMAHPKAQFQKLDSPPKMVLPENQR